MIDSRPLSAPTHSTPVESVRPSQTAAAPFKMSNSAVARPASAPAARIALVPPVRPLSMVRTSCPVATLTTSKPEGIEPSK